MIEDSEKLNIGDKSADLRIEIVDKDRLCYMVKVESRDSYGIRTISKQLLQEFVNYFRLHPQDSTNEAREALTGKSDLDKFEYGYAATLTRMAKMIVNPDEECIKGGKCSNSNNSKHINIEPLQQIYYGAPGTGKSYEINDITKSYSTIRTTFHPDSDYSTFVGAYKPTMVESEVQVVPVVTTNGISLEHNKGTYKEKRITYQYVKQAFLKAYLSAWKKYAESGETPQPQFLIIEEINRGNCAQIFGDLFQLLDRSDNGFSSYPIEADTDLQHEISKAFGKGGEYALADGFDIEGVVPGYDNITKAVKEGTVLLLPSNLYIWATMNTSDQSLFPIDSAFKRRWDWKYVKIADAHKDWTIQCGNEYCDWWTFICEINKKIAKETSSDDKKLGYFFCKPKKGETTISEGKFVGKVLFYLWNDVFKDGDTSLFKVSDNDEDEVTFEAFYTENGTENIDAIRKFLVAVVGDENLKRNNNEEDVTE